MYSSTTIQNYIDLLEKTNQQLGMWTNPYGVLVAALALIVAVLTIAFALILWRQGKEYRDIFNKFLLDQKTFAESELNKSIKETKITANILIEEQKEKLKTASGEMKQKIEAAITKLEKTKDNLDASNVIFSSFPSRNISWNGSNQIIGGDTPHIPTLDGYFSRLTSNCKQCMNSCSANDKYCSFCGNKLQ
ncbi:MAG: hypothetical protein WCG07_01575 [Candidatus Taylorbacteria bacterium]